MVDKFTRTIKSKVVEFKDSTGAVQRAVLENDATFDEVMSATHGVQPISVTDITEKRELSLADFLKYSTVVPEKTKDKNPSKS